MAVFWNFIEKQIFGMRWLRDLVENLFLLAGVNIENKIAESLIFFIYDVIKIFILLSVLIFAVSFIQSFFPPQKTKKILGKFKGLSANLVSALLGTVTPFCACSSIPIFMGFASAGVPVGVSFSFLISSPLVDLGAFVLLLSIFGIKIAAIYVLVGIILAVLGGAIIDRLKMEDEVEEFIRLASMIEVEQESLNFKERCIYSKNQVLSIVRRIWKYILLGVGIGAIIHNWIPKEWIVKILGSENPFSVIIATIAGAPMYADIFGTIPIAEALWARGAGLGTILAFMMSVTALSLPSVIMLKQAVKPKLLRTFVSIVIVGILIIGFVFNLASPIFI